jgi:signal recognition particle receptor subunit beta
LPTTSITEKCFNVQNQKFKFYDVAGQKDRRSRWAPYFEKNLDGLIFVASLAAFDQRVREAPEKNRFVDSLECFEELMGNRFLQLVPTIILFNKVDLFSQKCLTLTFKDHISHYTGIRG